MMFVPALTAFTRDAEWTVLAQRVVWCGVRVTCSRYAEHTVLTEADQTEPDLFLTAGHTQTHTAYGARWLICRPRG